MWGKIGLDPCANKSSIVGASIEWYGSHMNDVDGLKQDWTNKGLVFVNPPYGREIKKWAKKIHDEACNGAEIIFLGPSRTDTAWMQDYVLEDARAVLFIRGRLKFGGATNSAPFPSFLAYYGPNRQQFLDAFAEMDGIFI